MRPDGLPVWVAAVAPGATHDLTATRTLLLRSLRCRGERGLALLTGRWRTLGHITVSPRRIGPIAQATLVLTRVEHGHLNPQLAEKTSVRQHLTKGIVSS